MGLVTTLAYCTERFLVTLMKAVSLGGFVLASLDYRFGWSHYYLGPVQLWLKVLRRDWFLRDCC